MRVLDLHPGGRPAVREVATKAPFSHGPLHIALARCPGLVHVPFLDVLQQAQATLDGRHDATEAALAVDQGQASQILSLDREHVEGDEEGPLPGGTGGSRIAAAVGIEAADSAVEHGAVGVDAGRDLLGQLRRRLEVMDVVRYERAAVALHVCQRTGAFHLRLDTRSGWSKGPGMRRMRIGVARFVPGANYVSFTSPLKTRNTRMMSRTATYEENSAAP